MGSNRNGMAWKVITACIIPVMLFMGKEMIANEDKSQARDREIISQIVNNQEKQQSVNQQILVSLAEMNTDMKYLRQKVR